MPGVAHYWRIVERWQRPLHGGLTAELFLLQIDDVFVKGWRVEWPGPARREGVSFTGREMTPEQEQMARALLAEKMFGHDWHQVTAPRP